MRYSTRVRKLISYLQGSFTERKQFKRIKGVEIFHFSFSGTFLKTGVLTVILSMVMAIGKADLCAAPPERINPIEAITSGAEPRIYILNMQVGDLYYNIWGHSALMVDDPDLPEPLVFDYGLFSPDAGFIIRFILGEPTYWMDGSYWRFTRHRYDLENRGIYGQELRITKEKKMRLISRLLDDLKEENRFYHYHHFTNNCTTKIRDLVDYATEGALKRDHDSVHPGVTFRKLSTDFGRHMPVYWLLMNTAANERADHPITEWDYMFLPMLFMEKLSEWNYPSPLPQRGPIIGKIEILRPEGPHKDPESMDRTLRTFFVTLGAIYTIFFLFPALHEGRLPRILGKIGLYTWSITVGFTGLLFMILAIVSPRETFHDNYNMFTMSPILLYQAIHFAFIQKRLPRKINLYFYGFMIFVPFMGLILRVTTITGQEILPGVIFALFVQGAILAQYIRTTSELYSRGFFSISDQ